MELRPRVFVFDLGGTVFTKGKQEFIRILSARTNRTFQDVKNIIDSPISLELRKKCVTREQYWAEVRGKLDLSEDARVLEAMWFSQYRPVDGMFELIDSVRSVFNVAYLSNSSYERAKYLQDMYHIRERFDFGLYSYEVRELKGGSALYGAFIRAHYPLHPEQFIFIDDNPDNCRYVEQLGSLFIHFADYHQLRAHLETLGLPL